MENIAFIGLGNMGSPICRNIMKGGHTLYVYNRSTDKTMLLVQAGALRLKTPVEAFQKAKIVLTMLANDKALEEVTCGPNGLLESIQPGCIHISMSTVSPATSAKLYALHKEKGAHFIAAPVFGRPEAAVQARLWVCMAGDEAAKKEALPILQLIGQRVEDFGDQVETANVVKLAGNFMILSAIEAMGEAMQLTGKYGVEKDKFVQFFTETIFSAPVYKNYGKILAENGSQPVGFKMSLGLKDMNLVRETAEAGEVNMPFGALLHGLLLHGVQEGRGDQDWSAITRQ